MTGPLPSGGDDWDNIPTRGRSDTISEDWSQPTRARSNAISESSYAADYAHARLGVLYLFSKIYVDEAPVWMNATTRARSGAIVPVDQTRWQKFTSTVSEAVKSLIAWIKQKIIGAIAYAREHIEAIMEEVTKQVVDFVVGELWDLWKELSPIVGNAIEVYEGLKKTFENGKARFDVWISGAEQLVRDGHPQVIVASITHAMNLSIMKGLYDTIKSGLSLAGEFVSLGLSKLGEKIVETVTKAIEWIVSKVIAYLERKKMQQFFAEAETHWNDRHSLDALHLNHEKFVAWFKDAALYVPSIACIALLSHICGDKITYLAMYNAAPAAISQAEFTAASSGIDSMKPWAKKYLTDSGYNFMATDTTVSHLLGFPETPPTDMITSAMSSADAEGIATRARRG